VTLLAGIDVGGTKCSVCLARLAGDGPKLLERLQFPTPDSPGHAFRILRSYQPGEKVKLGVLRQRKLLVLDATMPAADATRGNTLRPRQVPPPAKPAAPDAGPA